ncbi:MAG TPA: hypothetical protein VJ746_11795 [Nitrospira sp.]|nr:hypothetical protein [Nitrospira sp.]
MGLAGCAADSAKSPSDTVASSPIAQAEQQAAGEVQERAVIRDQRMQSGPFTPSPTVPHPVGKPVPQPLVQGVRPEDPSTFLVLPGEFAIRTASKKTYLTARDGGHHTIDAVVTAATTPGPDEKFKVAVQPVVTDLNHTLSTIQTARGYYLSIVWGMGGQYDPSQVVQTEVTSPQQTDGILLWSRSTIPGVAAYTIQPSAGGYFLTALGGGGKTTGAFHSDATLAKDWEYFTFVKCGDLGSGLLYTMTPKGHEGDSNSMLGAAYGGGQVKNAVIRGGHLDWLLFRLIQQSDGSYAIQTSNHVNYVTAVGGGGLASGDNVHTDATQVQAWEKFRIVDRGDCAYTIQTVSGWYLAVSGNGAISTRISDPNAAPSIGYTATFELMMVR